MTAVANPEELFYPKSKGLSTRETALLTERTDLFMRRSMGALQAEQLAYKLVDRDRDYDLRRICMECRNLSRAGGWRCGNWQQAGIGAPGVPVDLVQLPQHCDGFNNAVQILRKAI